MIPEEDTPMGARARLDLEPEHWDWIAARGLHERFQFRIDGISRPVEFARLLERPAIEVVFVDPVTETIPEGPVN